MPLAAGSRLDPYEILSQLGAGGMGEVYRAKDTRLERMVAVKVLSSHLAASAQSRQRFEREAKTVSQLSHPHICASYDVGQQGETERGQDAGRRPGRHRSPAGSLSPQALAASGTDTARRPYDVAPDGERFLFIRRAPDAERSDAVVVLNWAAMLAAKESK